jgi:hypothetical protein
MIVCNSIHKKALQGQILSGHARRRADVLSDISKFFVIA